MAWRNVPPFASGEAPRNPATPHGATQQMELIPVVNHVDVSSRKFAVSAPFYGGLSDRLIPCRSKNKTPRPAIFVWGSIPLSGEFPLLAVVGLFYLLFVFGLGW